MIEDLSMNDANMEAKRRLVEGLGGRGAHMTFENAVKDLPDSLMNAKPDNVPYTFWHQIEHIRLTQIDIIEYIRDPDYKEPTWPADYWPSQDAETDRAGWEKSIKHYLADVDEFVKLIEDQNCNVLASVERNNNRSIMGSALIIIDHTAYHLGEFVMGRQILGAWQSELG